MAYTHEILTKVLGEDCCKRLIAAYGGQRIWVPKPDYVTTELVEAIGDEGAALLCRFFGGDWLDVPMGPGSVDLALRRQCAQMQREGARINDIAKAVGRSRRTIFRWLNKPVAELRRNDG